MSNQPEAPPGGPAPVLPYRDEIIISWPELHRDARYLSRVLHDLGEWKGIIAITRGGLVPAALVARELELRLIDTVCVVSYEAGSAGSADKAQGELRWLKGVEGDGAGWLLIDDLVDTGRHARAVRGRLARAHLGGAGWLLIDDLVDTGRTARAVRERLPRAHFATLYAKPAGRPLVDTFVKEFRQEKWIYFPWDIDYTFVSPIRQQRGGP
jgi:xanthine phosphoribosyltransferase